MKQLQLLMGMPITVEVVDPGVTEADIATIFAYFRSVDETFSTYKEHSEISKINRGELGADEYSDDMKTIFALSEQTRQETRGYFDIRHNGIVDPSGIVKGWAILQAATMLKAAGFMHFYIDAGGDIQVAGNKGGNPYDPHAPLSDIVSLTVIGPNVYESDRFATAAFAMGKKGIYFIEQLPGFEGYMIDASARATFTSGFERYVLQHDNTH